MAKPAVDKIATFTNSCFRWPSGSEALFLLLLTLVGLAANYLSVELFFGVNFIFGSIATMIAVRTSGPLWGTLAGIAISTYSYILWGHPYAIIIFGLEAFVVGSVACFLKKDNMILIDVGYWLFIGVPLGWILYYYQLGLPEPSVILVVLKQTANGLTNVVLASLLIQFTPVTQWVHWGKFVYKQKELSMYSAINTFLAAFILVPMLGATIMTGQGTLTRMNETLRLTVEDKAKDSARQVLTTMNYYSKILNSTIAIKPNQDDLLSWERMIKDFGKNKITGLINTELLSNNGRVLFSYPRQRSGMSHYADQLVLVTPDSDYLSDLHLSSQTGEPHFSIVSSIPGGRFLSSSFSIKIFGEQLALLSKGQQYIEVKDRQGNIVTRSDESDLTGFVEGVNPNHLLPSNTELPNMLRWRQAYWQDTTNLTSDNSWTIRVAAPMENSITSLQNDYIRTLMTMLLISIVALLLVPLVARMLSSQLNALTLAADMYSSAIGRVDVIWPKSNINEVNSLIYQFKAFVQTINHNQWALSQSEQRYAAIAEDMTQLVDTANAPIFGIDAKGRINEWNQQAENLTGFKKLEVMGLDLVHDFITDDHKASVDEVLARALKGEETANFEFPLFTQSGTRVDVLLNSTTRRDVTGKIVGVVGVGQDITELNQVRVEQEKERKLASAQIIQSSKLATLGEMATSVAHELNQPLSAIRMAAGNSRRNIAKGNIDTEYLNEKLNRIERQAARAAAIIDHMRMFGREAKENSELVDPRNMISNALDLMGAELRLAGIQVVIDFPEECASVLGHMIQMEQVILNLLTNARDAMIETSEEKKITLRVFEEGGSVHITSEDTGSGIPEEILSRIFEPFFTTKEMGKGTGLGLSVSYGIVSDMKGSIIAENSDSGARFSISLPKAKG